MSAADSTDVGERPTKYPCLHTALCYEIGSAPALTRWSEATIAAAVNVEDAGHLSPLQWTALLDDIEAALTVAIGPLLDKVAATRNRGPNVRWLDEARAARRSES